MKTKIDVRKIATLSNLFLTNEEEGYLAQQLATTIKHVESLNDINTDHIQGTNEVTDLHNVAREDVITPSLSSEDALRNAKKTHNGFFVVPVIIEEAIE